MTGKGSIFKQELLQSLFNTSASAVGSNMGHVFSAAGGLTQFWLSLHTGVPGTTSGRQDLNEATYTGYARVAVSRTTSGFTVSGGSAVLAANVTFGTASSSGQTITHFAIGSTSTLTGYLYYAGTVSPTITIDMGVIPTLTTGTTVAES